MADSSKPHWPLALAALALLLRLIGLGLESFWFDEIWAVRQARLSPLEVLADLRASDVHPPLWPLLLSAWIRLGEAEWLVRLPSAFFGALAVLGVTQLLRRAASDAIAWRGGLLLALSSYAVEFSQEARAYALLLALSAWSAWALLVWAERPERTRWGALWAGLAATLLYTHVFGAFVLLAEGLWALVHVPALRRRIVLAGALALAAYGPWIPSQIAQVTRVQEDFWIEPMRWFEPGIWVWHWAGYSVVVAAGLALGAALGGSRVPPPLRRLFVWMTACLVLLPGALSLVGQPIFQPKYAIAMLIPLFGVGGAALGRLPRWAEALVYAGMTVLLVRSVYLHTSKEQYRELARFGEEASRRGAVVVTEPGMWPYVSHYSRVPIATSPPERPELVTLLLAHPPRSEAFEATYATCRSLGERELVGARAVTYRCGSGEPP